MLKLRVQTSTTRGLGEFVQFDCVTPLSSCVVGTHAENISITRIRTIQRTPKLFLPIQATFARTTSIAFCPPCVQSVPEKRRGLRTESSASHNRSTSTADSLGKSRASERSRFEGTPIDKERNAPPRLVHRLPCSSLKTT